MMTVVGLGMAFIVASLTATIIWRSLRSDKGGLAIPDHVRFIEFSDGVIFARDPRRPGSWHELWAPDHNWREDNAGSSE